MEAPYCEMCGEEHVTLKLGECGVCDDCFANEIRAFLFDELGRDICGQPVRLKGLLFVCLEPHGTEHAHT